MKKISVFLLSFSIFILSCGPVRAECTISSCAKKCGSAIVWPFKKLGNGLTYVGSKIKGLFSN